MKVITYNKLVRDRIPEIIENEGKLCIVETLSDDEYQKMVDAKLDEELAEYRKDQNLEELADLLEVLYAATKARGYSLAELEACRKAKEEKRGAFEKKLFLKSAIECDEWPSNVEERLKIVNAISGAILEGTAFESARNQTETEPCINICPEGKTINARDRIAAIWAKDNRTVDFLVKQPVYEKINESVSALGIDTPRRKKTEYVYERVSLKQAVWILQLVVA